MNEEQQIKESFDLFATDGPLFTLDLQGLKGAMHALGFAEPRPLPVQVYYDEFVVLMSLKFRDGHSRKADLEKAFGLFDDDQTCKITFKNSKRVATELQMNETDEALQVMINEADKDGTGEITLKQFLDIISTAVPHPFRSDASSASAWMATIPE